MAQERVQRANGTWTTVVTADDETKQDSAKLHKDAVAAAKKEGGSVSRVDINQPVQEGHDLVVVDQDGGTSLSDQVPEDALNYNPDVNQEFNKGGTGVQGGGDSSNSPSAKEAAKHFADLQANGGVAVEDATAPNSESSK